MRLEELLLKEDERSFKSCSAALVQTPDVMTIGLLASASMSDCVREVSLMIVVGSC